MERGRRLRGEKRIGGGKQSSPVLGGKEKFLSENREESRTCKGHFDSGEGKGS